jgi:transposase
MPQEILPLFPSDITMINAMIGFAKRDKTVYYFHGVAPVFSHHESDKASFRLFTSQMVVNGNATQSEIVKAFGISSISMKRYVKKYREKGARAFFEKPRGRSATVLTDEVLQGAQTMLFEGKSIQDIADEFEINILTLRKTVSEGRLQRQVKKNSVEPDNKSIRSSEDVQASMGRGCTRTEERVAASLGCLQEAPLEFSPSMDVVNGGVLFALPALLANGLLKHTSKHFSLPKGYYGLVSLFLLLSYMAMARIRSIEKLRYVSPGELGRLLGLDRIPEVRTLRNKLEVLSKQGTTATWNSELSKDWMESDPDLAGILYVDGHTRVYHGSMTKLPRRFVSRDRLCLRGMTDYWVNDAIGQPFFLITTVFTDGLLSMLREKIVPRLITDVPNQPTEEQLKSDPYLSRFALVFDREGYSPQYFKEMWDKRISCYTYNKSVKDSWAEEEFSKHTVCFPDGQKVVMLLAERGVFVGKKLWMREIRRMTKSGHQTSLLTTAYNAEIGKVAAALFSRWSQENFFKYMREQFGIDRLIEYETTALPETVEVINPQYRLIESLIKSKAALLYRKKAEFGALMIGETPKEDKILRCYELTKAAIQEEIGCLNKDLCTLKEKRKEMPKRIPMSQLKPDERFSKLADDKKQIMDTVKMIAYRAETSMVEIIRTTMSRNQDARSLLQKLFTTEADILPDKKDGTLTVALHNMTNDSSDKTIHELCSILNESETVYPGTNLKLIYKLVSDDFLRGQEF